MNLKIDGPDCLVDLFHPYPELKYKGLAKTRLRNTSMSKVYCNTEQRSLIAVNEHNQIVLYVFKTI